MNRILLLNGVGIAFALCVGAVGARVARGVEPNGVEFFERKIRPVLVDRCYECHSGKSKSLKGGLRLDSRDAVLRGGDSGPAIVPGKADDSLLIQALRHEGLEMPPDQKLPGAVLRDFEEWVRIGAPDPRKQADGPETSPKRVDIDAGRKFWSFRPLADTPVPDVHNPSWPACDIDRFVLAKLESRGLSPATDADRGVLLRRVTFDLIGLPPTPSEIDAYVNDDSQDAFERVVDRLLASPHFGERWGRHWLDLARFAESSGGGRSMLFPEAWRYRDYVVQAFNDGLPYDRFLTEQIAGDLLPAPTPEERAAHTIATGFLVLGPHNYEEQDKAALEMNIVDEQIDTIGKSVLGMTLGCARCHDHKFDPIPTRDYYALAGIFRSTAWLVHENVSRWSEMPLPVDEELEKRLIAHTKKVERLTKQIAAMKERLTTTTNDASSDGAAETSTSSKQEKERLKSLEAELKELQAKAPYRPAAMGVKEADVMEECAIRIRGNVHSRGSKVPRGFLQVVPIDSVPFPPENRSGRRELAAWLISPEHPLTARVYVNRIWHHLFGAGLVRTVDNFGTAGEPPSHPELLDHLAREFSRGGWSTKQLVRTLVLSRTYRMAFSSNRAASAVDPENRLLWRANRKRLEAESLRDAMLVVSGALDLRMGGATIHGLSRSNKSGEPSREYDYGFDDALRSVYTPVLRNRLPELFESFDFSDPNQPIGARVASTTAPQALTMMNGTFVLEQSRLAGERLAALPGLSDENRIARAYRTALGRLPTDQETRVVLGALRSGAAGQDGSQPSLRWQRLFQALFSSVDFRYIE